MLPGKHNFLCRKALAVLIVLAGDEAFLKCGALLGRLVE